MKFAKGKFDTTFIDRVLAFEYDRWELDRCAIRHYLVELGRQVWNEGEGFSGRRPFGDNGWKSRIESALVAGGFVSGFNDLEDCHRADDIILACFDRLEEAAPLEALEELQLALAELNERYQQLCEVALDFAKEPLDHGKRKRLWEAVNFVGSNGGSHCCMNCRADHAD